MFNRILVPLDGSGFANQALEVACQLAEKGDTKLVLLHVLANKPLPKELRHFAEVEHLSDKSLPNRLGARIVEDAEAKAAKLGVQGCVTLVEEGDEVGVILATAAAENVDLIVMGSRGLGAVKELLLGSVSHKVTQMAPCCCMTVR